MLLPCQGACSASDIPNKKWWFNIAKKWWINFTCYKCKHNHIFLENLLPSCKVLNINTSQKQKQPKETNCKQKFQNPQNENISLTYLNMENKRNFHFLSFC